MLGLLSPIALTNTAFMTSTGLLTGLFLVYIGTEKTATDTSCFDCCLPGSAEEKDTELVPEQNNVDLGEGVT